MKKQEQEKEQEKEFVCYDIALSLKDLNFEKKCIFFWEIDYTGKPVLKQFQQKGFVGLFSSFNDVAIRSCPSIDYKIDYFGSEMKDIAFAPLWQQVIDWFREEYHLDITVKFPEPKGGKIHEGINTPYYDIEIKKINGGDVWNRYKFLQYSDNYYEARKKAVECGIEEIKNDKSYDILWRNKKTSVQN